MEYAVFALMMALPIPEGGVSVYHLGNVRGRFNCDEMAAIFNMAPDKPPGSVFACVPTYHGEA